MKIFVINRYALWATLVILLIGPLGYVAEYFIAKDPERVYRRLYHHYYLLRREAFWNGCLTSRFNQLLRRIPDINWQDEDGNTFIHDIVGRGMRAKRSDLCIKLLAQRFTLKVDLKNKRKKTALVIALVNYNTSAVRMLVLVGANIKNLDPDMKKLYDERMSYGF